MAKNICEYTNEELNELLIEACQRAEDILPEGSRVILLVGDDTQYRGSVTAWWKLRSLPDVLRGVADAIETEFVERN